MDIFLKNKKIIARDSLNFYSNDMTVAKEQLPHNQLKLTFQRNSIMDLDQKHKAWAQENESS